MVTLEEVIEDSLGISGIIIVLHFFWTIITGFPFRDPKMQNIITMCIGLVESTIVGSNVIRWQRNALCIESSVIDTLDTIVICQELLLVYLLILDRFLEVMYPVVYSALENDITIITLVLTPWLLSVPIGVFEVSISNCYYILYVVFVGIWITLVIILTMFYNDDIDTLPKKEQTDNQITDNQKTTIQQPDDHLKFGITILVFTAVFLIGSLNYYILDLDNFSIVKHSTDWWCRNGYKLRLFQQFILFRIIVTILVNRLCEWIIRRRLSGYQKVDEGGDSKLSIPFYEPDNSEKSKLAVLHV